MEQSSDNGLDRVLAQCRTSRFTGELRISSPQGQGQVKFLSGVAETSQFGTERGDAALDRMKQSGRLQFEVVRALPPLSSGSGEPLAEQGSLGELTPMALLRYCEEQALTCMLEVRAAGKVVRAKYELGELMSLEPEADMTMSVLEAQTGTYEFQLPNVELPPVASTPRVVKAPPRPPRRESLEMPGPTARQPSTATAAALAAPVAPSAAPAARALGPTQGGPAATPLRGGETSPAGEGGQVHAAVTLKPERPPAERKTAPTPLAASGKHAAPLAQASAAPPDRPRQPTAQASPPGAAPNPFASPVGPAEPALPPVSPRLAPPPVLAPAPLNLAPQSPAPRSSPAPLGLSSSSTQGSPLQSPPRASAGSEASEEAPPKSGSRARGATIGIGIALAAAAAAAYFLF